MKHSKLFREIIEALEEIADPIRFMRARAKENGTQINGMMAVQLANDPHFLKDIARQALAKLNR